MRRRELLALMMGLAAGANRLAQAQAKLHRIGFLRAGEPPKPFMDAFVGGLEAHGFFVGRNVEILYKIGKTEELVRLAVELADAKVDVIVASASSAAVAAKEATTAIPIVMAAVYHPIEVGIVASLARPGGNITGTAVTAGDLAGKRLELLREIAPGSRRIAVLSHIGHASNAVQVEAVEAAGRVLGLEMAVAPVKAANEFEVALRALGRIDAVLHTDTPLFNSNRESLLLAISKLRLPSIHPFREFVVEGGLASYGANLPELFRRSATYVAEILKGGKTTDMPVEQPTKFELAINLKTAKSLGLAVAPTILVRADEVVE